MPRELWFVRHPKVSVSGICYGHADLKADFGDDELDALLGKLPRFGAVWSSPLSRCKRLAARVAERLALPLRTDDRLRELGFGAFEGLAWSEIETRFPEAYAAWMGDWQRTPPPGGETLSELTTRIADVLSVILSTDAAAEKTLVVTHAGVIRAVHRLTENLSWDEALARPIPHLEPQRVIWEEPERISFRRRP
jgi:alpha-ribazole phosphatase